MLVVPYTETVEVEERDANGVLHKQLRQQDGRWTFFPKRTQLQGRVSPSIRKLGLHEVRVYEAQATLDAAFDARLPRTIPRIRAGSERRGSTSASATCADWSARRRCRSRAGRSRCCRASWRSDGGVHAMLPDAIAADGRIAFPLRLAFALDGTEQIIAPLADDNHVELDSPWPHPQFNGDFRRVRTASTRTASTPPGKRHRWRATRRRNTAPGRQASTPSVCRWSSR